MQEQSRQYTNEIFVSLPDLTANLEHLAPHTRCIVRHQNLFVASITLGESGRNEPPHFVVRPYGCDSRRMAKMDAEFVLKVPEKEQTFHIDPKGVGGHYAQGVRISIGGHEIILPAIKSELHTLGKQDDCKALSLPENSPTMKAMRAHTITGSDKTERLTAKSLSGTASGVIGIGKRGSNEDLIGAKLDDDSSVLFALDGNHTLDSEGQGKIAAEIVSDMILRGIQADRGAIAAFREVPELFRAEAQLRSGPSMYDMGCCGIVAEIKSGSVTFAHIGDCRGMVLRPGNWGKLEVIHETRDHSIAQELRDANFPEHQITAHDRRTVTRMIKARPPYQEINPVEVSDSIALKPGDVIVVMSDGMHKLGVKALQDHCRWKRDAETIVTRATSQIENIIKARQSADNFSLVVFKYEG